jgi:hypothetical protein
MPTWTIVAGFGRRLMTSLLLLENGLTSITIFLVKAPKAISRRAISHLFQDLLKREGINQVRLGHKKREVMTSHGVGEFFFNQREKANINYTSSHVLSGHKLRKVDYSYKKSTEEDMLAE